MTKLKQHERNWDVCACCLCAQLPFWVCACLNTSASCLCSRMYFLCSDMSSWRVYVPACVFHSNNMFVHFQHACMCIYVYMYLFMCIHVCVCFLCFFRSSFDVCSPHTCSLYTALCSGWSRSGCAALAVVLSAAVQPGPSRPCQPSSTPRSS